FELAFSPNQLLVTGGGQQAIFLIFQTILSAGEGIAVETPSFFYRLPLFKASGTRLFGIPMDDEGIDLEKLKESIHKNKLKAV
ncbi:aminotransferase class I/II-fold pyridoxal phosphate-dependent enzyme, partial [Enterococcus faecium]|uniref:aminotransferase class I/II-fold pyridoxal phosphate-dependent enzyme n=1 Tax=Enterococcus faecium TaxID=1352 RepID=UPI003CC5F165